MSNWLRMYYSLVITTPTWAVPMSNIAQVHAPIISNWHWDRGFLQFAHFYNVFSGERGASGIAAILNYLGAHRVARTWESPRCCLFSRIVNASSPVPCVSLSAHWRRPLPFFFHFLLKNIPLLLRVASVMTAVTYILTVLLWHNMFSWRSLPETSLPALVCSCKRTSATGNWTESFTTTFT